MQFTEHELTTAVAAAAKSVIAAQRKDVRKGKISIDDVWQGMDRHERYKLLKAMGTQVLPVLAALPEVDVAPGERPTFTQAEIATAVGDSLDEGAGGKLRRKVVLTARVAIIKAALDQLPPRGGFSTSPPER